MNTSFYGKQINVAIICCIFILALFLCGCEGLEDYEQSMTPKADEHEVTILPASSPMPETESPDYHTKPSTTVPDSASSPVSIKVDFPENSFMNKYDVDMYIDDSLVASYGHGKSSAFQVKLTNGNHSVRFEKNDNSSIFGELTLLIRGTTEVTYHISCETKYIKVEEMAYNYIRDLAEGEIRLGRGQDAYIGAEYSSVIKDFEKEGFTNITAIPEYDSESGNPKPKTIKQIFINNQSSFERGTIVKLDDEIVIVYHLPKESDPSRHVDAPKSTPTTPPTPTNTPIPELTKTPTPTPKKLTGKLDEYEKDYYVFYVVNVNSYVFHEPNCYHVKQMKEKNKNFATDHGFEDWEAAKEWLISQGYVSCGTCNP